MAITKCLLAAALLIVASQSIPVQDNEMSVEEREKEEDFYRLPQQVVPVHYDVQLIPHIVEDNFTFNGEASIDVKVLESTDVVVLHTKLLTIDELQTRLARKIEDGVNDVATNYVPRRHDYNNRTQMLTLRFDEPLDIGAYTLDMKFLGIITEIRGFYRNSYFDNEGNKVWLALTHLQPVSARQAFPCWDEPAMKATFKFSIKHYPNYTALSNMPSTRSEVDETDGKVWTRFETTPVMPTNVLGFVIADYDHVSNLDGTMRIWAPKHLLDFAARHLDIAEKATRELEKFTNSTVPVPKMDHVVAPQHSSRATENWGMIVYRLDVLLYDENTPPEVNLNLFMRPIDSKLYNTMTITHELAHQWFGNLVSPAWWKYLWLSEGISTYLKFYITDKIFKDWRLMDYFVVDTMQRMINIDAFRWAEPIHINITSNIYNAYSDNTYKKSAFLLRMISHFLREDVFRNGLIKYLRANAYGNATPDDLWKALQDALDESDVPHDDFNVKEVMDTWFEQANYPDVTVVRNYENGDVTVTQKLTRHENQNVEKSYAKWWVPLNFATQSNLDFSSTLATHWLRPQDESVTIKGVNVEDWIIVNKQLTGYYRVNYDTTNWKRIAAFLNSDDYAEIPVLNRAQIIDDAFAMTETGQLDLITFLEIMNYLSRESDTAVWQAAFKIIQQLDIYLQVPEAAAIFKPFAFNLTHKILEDVGFDDRPDDDPLTVKTRSHLGDFACMHGHAECQAKATAKLLAYIEDPVANKISQDQQWAFCFGLMKADNEIWDKFLQVQNMTLDFHLTFLGCSENMDIVIKHLKYIRTLEDRSFPDTFHVLLNIFKNPSNIDRMINFVENNPDEVTSGIEGMILFTMINRSFTEEQIEKVKKFSKIVVETELSEKKQKLTRIRNNLAKVRSALEKNQFSVAMHITLVDNNAS
ncbi:PREDICTED: aminopeptidase N-like [Dinoponera quadriceps]|uniref:Aminopeptidase n=1 Tax=Dinoponera quadriceps TaxID=609295 RepID=A0A6P3X1J8_DINQU|nr:PREDICTED: aminopeptidase N-like [Dinoponera quadriceps]